MFKNLSVVIFGQRYNDGPPPLCIRLQGQVLNNIAFALIVSMFAKCLVFGGSFFFILLTLVLVFFPLFNLTLSICALHTSLIASVPKEVCHLSTPRLANGDEYRPSLESFLQASKTDADQDPRLSGLAVVSKLANARQSLVGVSKSRIHDTATFSCGDLALNAQNAGYSVVTYFGDGYCGPDRNVTKPHTQEEVLIPIVFVQICVKYTTSHSFQVINDSNFLKAADKAVENIIATEPGSDELCQMAEYLKRLYYWFLLGPIITLEWLRRKKKLCCVTISQQVHDESAAGNEENARLVTRVEEGQEQNIQDITGKEIESESQPLIITIDTDTDVTFDQWAELWFVWQEDLEEASATS